MQIRQLAKLSGFSALLLRTWERRYGLLEPQRLENGYRFYTEDDLHVLTRVRELLAQGATIGDIARMGRAKLGVVAREKPAEPPARVEIPELSVPKNDATVSAAHLQLDIETSNPELAWSILDALPCAVIVTDTEGRVRWVNRGVPVLCGYDLVDMHGLKPGVLLQGPKTQKDAVRRLRSAIDARRRCTVRIVNYHKSGEPYLALVDLVPLGIGAKHAGFIGLARRIDDAGGRRLVKGTRKT